MITITRRFFRKLYHLEDRLKQIRKNNNNGNEKNSGANKL